MIQKISGLILKMLGWRVEGEVPEISKYVLIGAPHTSNWDFMYTLLSLSSIGLKFNWVAKHTLFFWPLGVLFRAIGGIPVDRQSGTAFLKKCISLFKERENFIMAISPEGTRSYTKHWKTGFYMLAVKAEVPVVMGYIDYPAKVVGVGGILNPTGNLAEDMKVVEAYYAGKNGRDLSKQGPVAVKQKK